MSNRLFVAVVPPISIRDSWEAFLEPRRSSAPDLRWTDPVGWHVTCAFMASVPEGRLASVEDALAEVAERTSAFAVTVEGAGAFPDPDHARAFWLGVTEGADALGRLARRTRNAAARSGIEVDGARFRPHLTIARANGISGTGWLEVFGAIPAQTWTVDRFALVRSQLLPGGAGYQTLAEFVLPG